MMEISIVLVIAISLIPSEGLSMITHDQITYEDVKHANLDRPPIDTVLGKYLNYPGLQFEPNIASEDGLIRYAVNSNKSISVYTDRLEALLAKYELEHYTSTIMDCFTYSGYRSEAEWDHPCMFDPMVNLGNECVKEKGFGYEDGQPCIALYLDRILNWLPEPYTNDTVPEKIRNEWIEYAVTVHCEGEDPVTIDNLGDVDYYPHNGFHFKYFPYIGQQSWMAPVVFAKLTNAEPGIALNIKCSVYAKNIKRDDMLNTGKVSFDIIIDYMY